MSRPSEPEEMVSTSIALSVLPSRMIEPLPKLRSIWESAASRAFDLSMDDPSTRRSAAWLAPLMGIVLLMTGFPGAGKRVPGRAAPRLRPANLQKTHCTRFVLRSQYVLFCGRGTGRFPRLVADFGSTTGRFRPVPAAGYGFRGQCPNFRGQCPNSLDGLVPERGPTLDSAVMKMWLQLLSCRSRLPIGLRLSAPSPGLPER